jgi:hypothetical protein
MELTVHSQTAEAGAPPRIIRTIALMDRAAALQPRTWALDTAALAPGQFVLRLTIRDGDHRSADTAVLFDVIAPGSPVN